MTINEIKKILTRYTSGKASEAEKEKVENFLNKKAIISEEIWSGLNTNEKQEITHQTYQKILTNISPKTFIHKKWVRIAAVLLPIAMIGSIYLLNVFTNNKAAQLSRIENRNMVLVNLQSKGEIFLPIYKDTIISSSTGDNIIESRNGVIVINKINDADNENFVCSISTPKNQRCNIVLSDGSSVKLNALSTLTFATMFSAKERNIKIVGEAYFEVAKNPLKPFIVETPYNKVRALGTIFNVKAYRNDEQSETTLIEGKVEVTLTHNQHKKYILTPNQKLIVSQQPEAQKKEIKIDEVKYLHVDSIQQIAEIAWIENKFYFNNSTLDDIVRTLERNTGYVFEIKNEQIREIRFTATYLNENINDILSSLKAANENLNFEIKDKTITLY